MDDILEKYLLNSQMWSSAQENIEEIHRIEPFFSGHFFKFCWRPLRLSIGFQSLRVSKDLLD